jgi:thiamine kinase-like enzyme
MFSLGDHAIEPVDRIVARRDLLANALTLLMRFCGIPYPRLSRLDWSNNRMWQWERIQSLLANDPEEVVRLFENPEGTVSEVKYILASLESIKYLAECAGEWIEGTSDASSLPIGAIHGDFAPRNVLANAESVSGIVDWDDCQVEWLAWDLAKAAWEFCSERDICSPVPRKLIDFWETYETSLGMQVVRSVSELMQFIWSVRCIEIFYALGDALNGDRWYPKCLLLNLRSALQLIAFKT